MESGKRGPLAEDELIFVSYEMNVMRDQTCTHLTFNISPSENINSLRLEIKDDVSNILYSTNVPLDINNFESALAVIADRREKYRTYDVYIRERDESFNFFYIKNIMTDSIERCLERNLAE